MTEHFNEKIPLQLKRDEATVLFWYLTRHFLTEGGLRMKASFDHPAEELALEGLMHEMMPQLSGPKASISETEYLGALEHLSARFR